jgi:hypothetical protein
VGLFSRDRIMRRSNCVEWSPRAGQTRVTLAHFKIRPEQTVVGLVMIPPRSMNFSGSRRLENSGDQFRPV